MAFDRIVTKHGNFAEVTRKAVNAANQIRSRMFGKINPQDRIDIIREHAKLLMDYADALEQIWETEKQVQAGILEPKPYMKLEDPKDEDVSKSLGNGKGSRKGPVRNGDQVSEQDSPGSAGCGRSEISNT